MKQHAKIQVGNMLLDGEITVEYIIPEHVKKELERRKGLYGTPPSFHFSAKIEPFIDPGKTVEGSITELITDEKRLVS